MQNREAFNLKPVIFYYNILQILVCLYLFCKGSKLIFGWNRRFSWLCEPVEWEDTPYSQETIRLIWMYTTTKLVDLLDTVFFVLRKKNNKVSFLHLYHHTGMVLLTWSCIKWLPGGHDLFIGYINLFVHTFMYLYYTLALTDSRKYIWMKKYITQLQMIQFFLNILHSGIILFQPNCGYPKWTTIVMIPQNTFMLFLFFDFYRKEYLRKKPEESGNHHHVE
ncbi:very long chain fatty acid elongase 4-like isoform X2 [Rhodnius prolixus]